MFIRWLKTSVYSLLGICLIGFPINLASANMEHRTPRWISSTVFFESANACMWAGVASEVCQAGHRSAFRQHLRVVPSYRELADCESDFFAGECFASNGAGSWSPWLSGFAIITHVQLSGADDDSSAGFEAQAQRWERSRIRPVQAAAPETRVRYFSEPLYWESDHQGGQRLTSLREKLRNGERFDHALSRRPSVIAGSVASQRRLARVFEPQRLFITLENRTASGGTPLAF
jgi:hypothetical protein